MSQIFIVTLLIFSIAAGQLIKIPIGQQVGLTLLDFTLIFFAFLFLSQKVKTIRLTTLTKSALIFLFIAIISLLVSPLKLSNNEFFQSLGYSVRFLLIFLVSILVASTYKEKVRLILLYSGITIAIIGLLQFIFIPDLGFLENQGFDPHYFRTVSTFLDPNFTGAYLTLTLLILVSYRLPNKIKYPLFFIIFLALLTTFSRGAYLMFGVSFISLSILKHSTKTFILTTFLCSILLLSFLAYQQLIATPRNIDRAGSASYRFQAWEQGWQVFTNSPLLGVGFNAYRYALEDYRLATDSFLNTRGSSSNDSSLLSVLATTGIVGLISFLFFLRSLLLIGWRAHCNNIYGTVFLSALVGIIIHSFFTNSLFYPFLLFWITLMAYSLD
jgi:putative inorganic carbon (hco3(-)) transporter